MSIQLRPYQQDLISKIYTRWGSGDKRVMGQCPTGSGKTVCFTAIVRDFVSSRPNKKILILAHRQELICQAANKIISFLGLEPGVIKNGCESNYDAQIQVGSIQSVVSQSRLEKLEDIGLIIIDEAHHFNLKNSYGKILNQFPDAYVLGVTATPKRLDGKGFEDYFDSLVCGISVQELIERGYLSPFRLYAANRQMKTEGIKTRHGDYSVSQLAQQNDAIELAGNLIDTYRTYANGKKTIVFAINVEHSKAIAKAYNDAGIEAAHLDGTHTFEDRLDTLNRFREGEIEVLSNCQLFTEGFDLPNLEVVQIARPTQSLSLWLQMVGRVLRPSEGKELALILDHTNNYQIHKLPNHPRVWTLDGKPKKAAKQLQKDLPNLPTTEKVEKEIVETQHRLAEVVATIDQQWREAFQELVQIQTARKYKKSWIYYRLKEMIPPLPVWQMCGDYLGYKSGWAYYQFQEQEIV